MRSVGRALLAIPWAYAWLVLLVIALRVEPHWAVVLLLGTIGSFCLLYVWRPVRGYPRLAARLRLRPWLRYLPWLTLAALLKLAFALSSLLVHDRLATRRILPSLPEDPEVVSQAFLASPFGLVALFLGVAVLAPLIEEFAFRGWMQHEIEHAIGLVPAIAASAIAFSLLHGRIEAIHHLAFGVFAGWTVWRTGSIWTGVYMHAVNNGVAQLLMVLTDDATPLPSPHAAWLWPAVLAVGTLSLGGFIVAGTNIHRLAQAERPRIGAWSRKRLLRPSVAHG